MAVEYFSKWVEAEALAKITDAAVRNFLWKNVVCRFGVPKVLISDNGSQFQSKRMMEWCRELGIEQHFTSVGNPQSNGQTEVTNHTIVQYLKTKVQVDRELGQTSCPPFYGPIEPLLEQLPGKPLSAWYTDPRLFFHSR